MTFQSHYSTHKLDQRQSLLKFHNDYYVLKNEPVTKLLKIIHLGTLDIAEFPVGFALGLHGPSWKKIYPEIQQISAVDPELPYFSKYSCEVWQEIQVFKRNFLPEPGVVLFSNIYFKTFFSPHLQTKT